MACGSLDHLGPSIGAAARRSGYPSVTPLSSAVYQEENLLILRSFLALFHSIFLAQGLSSTALGRCVCVSPLLQKSPQVPGVERGNVFEVRIFLPLVPPRSCTQFHISQIPEAEFLDIIGIKCSSVFLLAIHSHLYQRILLPPPIEQKWF
jgi:hypothetical protein